jgi:hypothetical protein
MLADPIRSTSRRTALLRTAVALIATAATALTLAACAHPSHSATPGDRYLAIARPANEELEDDFDALAGPDRSNLDAAHGHLRDVAAVERAFDRALLALALPGSPGATARTLVSVNEARAILTDQATGAPTLAALRTFDPRLAAADADVEAPVRALRRELGLPPPEDS